MSDNSTGPRRFKFAGFDAAAVSRAEAALKTLSANFDQWMHEELARLEAAHNRVRAEGFNVKTAENLYFRAHDIKGLGGTYGYPLVTRIAGSLCRILHDSETRLSVPLPLVEAHVDAIGAAVRDNLRTDANEALAKDLENQAARLMPVAA